MVQTAERGSRAKRRAPGAAAASDLPWSIELWNDNGRRPLRVIARARDAALARAIFKAAAAENPERKLTLRHNGRIVGSTE